MFGSIELDYKAVLNVVALLAFAALMRMTLRRGQPAPAGRPAHT